MVAGSTSWVVGLAEEPPRRVSCSWIVDPTRGSLSPPIYVFGGCDDSKSSKWGEVFDPKKQTWDALPMPPPHCSRPLMCEKIVIKEEKEMLAMTGTGQCLSYIPSESKWKEGNRLRPSALVNLSSRFPMGWHVIENVVYCSNSDGLVTWCEAHKWESPETEVVAWREVMGLEALRDTLAASKLVSYAGRLWDYWETTVKPELLARRIKIQELDQVLPGHKLSNSGPNLLIFWDVLVPPHKLEIWCAEISLVRRKETFEIRGNIVWSQVVITLDPPPHHHHCRILSALPLNL
ncbi:putative F-box/kelch-repeat protein At3g24610 [Brassica rapa]|nr:putative F-box/kelch-repeat protein At3g24610 [Brassica rapa]